jgi:hypothetical protein
VEIILSAICGHEDDITPVTKIDAAETMKICLLDGRAALDSYHRYENVEEELEAIFESVSAPFTL